MDDTVPAEHVFQCAICLEDGALGHKATMPCCARDGSTIAFCRRCTEVICERGGGGVGRCPTCRHYIKIGGDGEVELAVLTANCRQCQQMRVIVDNDMCERCLLGTKYCFTYECDGCHQLQRIPHPMFMYQRAAAEFSTDTWACHRGCETFTHWRIVPEHSAHIPPEHCPESWGRREVAHCTARAPSCAAANTHHPARASPRMCFPFRFQEWIEEIRAQRRLERRNGPARAPALPASDWSRSLVQLVAVGALAAAAALLLR
jgi:hypothetical protein